MTTPTLENETEALVRERWDGKPRVADYRRVGIVFLDAYGNELQPGCPWHELLLFEVEAALLKPFRSGDNHTLAAAPFLRWEQRPQVLQ